MQVELKWYRDCWCAYWRDEDNRPQRRSLRTKDRAIAEQALVDFRRGLVEQATTIVEITENYFEDRKAWAGLERARYAWLRLKPYFANLRPDQVDRSACRRYADVRGADGVGAGTIRKELLTLSAICSWHSGGADKSPVVLELPSKPAPKTDYLTWEQFVGFRAATRQTPHVYLFAVLAYTTGGRSAALLELRWDQIDFGRELIALGDPGIKRQKGRAVVPMNGMAKEALLEAAAARTCDHVIEFNGKPILRMKNAFGRAAVRAGLPWVTPHVLRHTAAVHMAEAGNSMDEIAQYLGHDDVDTTRRIYARFSPGYLRKAAAALDEKPTPAFRVVG